MVGALRETMLIKAPYAWAEKLTFNVSLAPLIVDGLLAQFAKQRNLAQRRYAQFVAEGIAAVSPWSAIKGQVFLGNDQFVQRMQAHLQAGKDDDVQIPFAQRRPLPPSLAEIERHAQDRNSAIVAAYVTGAYSYQKIAEHFRIHFTTVGRIVRADKGDLHRL